MKKYIYLIITILASVIMGGFFIDAFLNINFTINSHNFLLVVLLIILGVLIAYIIYDLGQLLFAKLGRFKIVTFKILNTNFNYRDGRIKVCKSLYKDHYHSIVIASEKENTHYNLAYLGGVTMNLIVALIVQLSSLLINSNSIGYIILIVFGFVNALYALINALPLSFLYNDGYFLYNLLKQKAAIQAFHQKNALNEKLVIGKNFDELNFSIYRIDNLNNDYNDPIILEYKELETYHYLYQLHFKEALDTVDYVFSKSNKMLSLYKKTFTNLKLILLILMNQNDDALNLYLSLNSKHKRYICKCKTLDDSLAAYLIHKFINKDEVLMKKDYDLLIEYIKYTPYIGEKEPLKGLLEYIENL